MNQWGAIWIVSLRWSFIPGGVHCSSILSPPATSVYCWLDFDWESIANSASGFGLDLNIFKHPHEDTWIPLRIRYPQIQWSIIVFPIKITILQDTLHFQTDLFPSSATAGLTWRVSIRPSLCQCDSCFAFLHIMHAFGDGSKKIIRSHRFSRFIAGKIIKQFLGDFPTCLLTRALIWPNFLGISGRTRGPGSGTPVVLGSLIWILPTVQLRPLGSMRWADAPLWIFRWIQGHYHGVRTQIADVAHLDEAWLVLKRAHVKLFFWKFFADSEKSIQGISRSFPSACGTGVASQVLHIFAKQRTAEVSPKVNWIWVKTMP